MRFNHVILMAAASALAIAFVSCKKDEPVPAPTIKVVHSGAEKANTDEVGTPFEIHVACDEATTLTEVTLAWETEKDGNKSTANIPASGKVKAKDGKPINGMKKATILITSDMFPEGSTMGKLKITVMDKAGSKTERIQEKVKVVTNTPTPPTPTPPTPEEPLMGDEKTGVGFSHGDGAGKGAFDLKAGTDVSAKSKKEQKYMINNTEAAGKEKEFVAGWTSGKVTIQGIGETKLDTEGNGALFKKVDIDYEKATVKQCEEAIKEGGVTTVKDVKENDIFVAKYNDELYILKITKIDKTKNRANVGHILFSYKRKK